MLSSRASQILYPWSLIFLSDIVMFDALQTIMFILRIYIETILQNTRNLSLIIPAFQPPPVAPKTSSSLLPPILSGPRARMDDSIDGSIARGEWMRGVAGCRADCELQHSNRKGKAKRTESKSD